MKKTNEQIELTISTINNKGNISLSKDYSQYYTNLAREWAIKNGLVANEDYSAKYYANLARENKETTDNNLQIFRNESEKITEEINNSYKTIDNKTQTAIENITNEKSLVISEIEQTKMNVINEVQHEANTQITNIKQTGFYMEDDKLYYVDNNGEIKEFKSGASGLEVGDIGVAAFGIDESKGLRRYLNGSLLPITANTQGFLNKLKSSFVLYSSLVCTEEQWQTAVTMSTEGQCGKFVIDEENGTIRLPKVVKFQGCLSLSNIAETIEAGVPNIDGDLNQGPNKVVGGNTADAQIVGRGALKVDGLRYIGGFNHGNGYSYGYNIQFDASRSNPIYGKSETVQEEAIQYPYFIQIATGAETEVNIVNEIELNNPYTLFDSKYSEKPLYNASWLLSDGEFKSKSLYPSVYNALLIENNPDIMVGEVTTIDGWNYVKRGLDVKLSTDADITDYDFVLNLSDETFRLPLRNGSEDLPSDKHEPLELKSSGSTYDAPANGWFALNKNSNGSTQVANIFNVTKGYGTSDSDVPNGVSCVLNLFCEKGDTASVSYSLGGATTAFEFVYAKGNGTLYYYVGETVQNANLINAGVITEVLASQIKIIDTYVNGTSGYNIWSNGYCEQWGQFNNVSGNNTYEVALLKTYGSLDFNIQVTLLVNSSANSYAISSCLPNSPSSISLNTNGSIAGNFSWVTRGYLAEGEY